MQKYNDLKRARFLLISKSFFLRISLLQVILDLKSGIETFVKKIYAFEEEEGTSDPASIIKAQE
jgi:hypothetical protein